MNCSDFQKRVSSYPDKSLPTAERASLDEHGTVCSVCAPALKVFRAMHAGFATLPAIGTTDEFERRVVRRVAREREEGGGRIIEFPAWGPRVGLALAAGLLLFVGWQIVNRDGGAVDRRMASRAPAQQSEALTVTRQMEKPRAGTDVDADVALAPRDDRSSRSSALDLLLDEGGTPLVPPGSGRKYVIDRPTDLPRLLSEGAEGELASTPISF
ncbi:MAG: zf-HC2 domain-containing protein [bacterium]